jgi:hypothetical protein
MFHERSLGGAGLFNSRLVSGSLSFVLLGNFYFFVVHETNCASCNCMYCSTFPTLIPIIVSH